VAIGIEEKRKRIKRKMLRFKFQSGQRDQSNLHLIKESDPCKSKKVIIRRKNKSRRLTRGSSTSNKGNSQSYSKGKKLRIKYRKEKRELLNAVKKAMNASNRT
jgi:hypothetical protein